MWYSISEASPTFFKESQNNIRSFRRNILGAVNEEVNVFALHKKPRVTIKDLLSVP